jgi:hypothetical protein
MTPAGSPAPSQAGRGGGVVHADGPARAHVAACPVAIIWCALALLVVAGSGCFTLDQPDVAFQCTDPGAGCPSGYACCADHRCHRIGSSSECQPADGGPDGSCVFGVMPAVRVGSVAALVGVEPLAASHYAPSVTPWAALHRSLYFASDSVADGGTHIYLSEGQDPDTPHAFSSPVPVAALNSADTSDSHPEVSADDLLLVLDSTRDSAVTRLYLSERELPGDPWGSPRQLDEVPGGALGRLHATLSVAGGLLVYAVGSPPNFEFWQASWHAETRDFGESMKLAGFVQYSASPALGPDGLTVVYSATVDGIARLYASRRSTPLDPTFGCRQPVDGLEWDGTFHDGDPFITREGQELFFASTRGDGVARLFKADLEWR